MTAFLRFSQRKDLQYYAPDLTGPSGGDGNGYIHVIDQNASQATPGPSRQPLFSKPAWASPICLAAKSRRISAARAMSAPVRRLSRPADDAQPHRRTQHADHHRTHRPGPPNQQSAVPKSHFLGSGTQLFEDTGPAFPQSGLSIPVHPHRDSGHQSALWPRHVQRGIQQTHLRGTGPAFRLHDSERLDQLQPGGFLSSALPTRSTWGAMRSSICGSSCTRCIFRTTIG